MISNYNIIKKINTNTPIELYINNSKYITKHLTTILNACKDLAGINIPRFCYHEKLGIAGNCRLCIVLIIDNNTKKLVLSCITPISNKISIITTQVKAVLKARRRIIEYILRTHPLDCPICEKGGHCDLQDVSYLYGHNYRTLDIKTVKDLIVKNYTGPIIKTVMNRCIDCTKCTRFIEENTLNEKFIHIGRGKHSNIALYLADNLNTEFSNNLVDLCPVGALLHNVTVSRLRLWDTREIKTIDFFDSAGYPIIVQQANHDNIFVRAYHTTNNSNNWLTDKTKFVHDSSYYNRIQYPEYYNGIKSQLITWKFATNILLKKLSNKKRLKAVIGDFIDTHSIFYMKKLFNYFGSNNIVSQEQITIDADFKTNFIFNNNNLYLNYNSITMNEEFPDSEKYRRLCFLIGSSIRFESSSLNNKIGELVRNKRLLVITFGSLSNLNYFNYNLGNNIKTLIEICQGRHLICKYLTKNTKTLFLSPIIIIGNSILRRFEANSIIRSLKNLNKYFNFFSNKLDMSSFNKIHNSFNFLAPNLNQLILTDTGISNFKTNINYSLNKIDFLYLLGTNGYSTNKRYTRKTFIVYQGHHLHNPIIYPNKPMVNLKLPTKMITEKNGFYITTFGFVEKINKLKNISGYFMLEDSEILRTLIKKMNLFRLKNNMNEINLYLRKNKLNKNALFIKSTNINLRTNISLFNIISNLIKNNIYIKFNKANKINFKTFKYFKDKIYLTTMYSLKNNLYDSDNLSRASKILTYNFSETIELLDDSFSYINYNTFFDIQNSKN